MSGKSYQCATWVERMPKVARHQIRGPQRPESISELGGCRGVDGGSTL
jgi:hypothetical protein